MGTEVCNPNAPARVEGVTEAAGARGGPRTRADALRNRDRIVAAARDVFVEEGPKATLDEIARRAGVGNATLYRHFSDRESLLHAVLLQVVCRIADHAERVAAADVDAFAALRQFLHAAVDERIGAICGLLAGSGDWTSATLSALYARVEAAGGRLLERARWEGRIRGDVDLTGLMVAASQLARPLPGNPYRDVDVHRHLELLLDGLRIV